MTTVLPSSGAAHSDLIAEITAMQAGDVDWREGRVFALVFHPDDDVRQVAIDAYLAAADTNALSTRAFSSLGTMEREVLQMAGSLVGLPDPKGSLTAGGSESIFVAVKTARDAAIAAGKGPQLNIVLPRSAHPAFAKAAHCLAVQERRAELRDDGSADPDAMSALVDESTALVVASAPSYPWGVVDDLAAVGELAAAADVPMHVDACVGGFVLPFLADAGGEPTALSFDISAVASMSIDAHKYGYALKGSSILLIRDAAYAAHQPFHFDDWPGGLYVAPNILGTRPGGAIAATWATMRYLGRDGYVAIVRRTLASADRIRAGIRSLGGVRMLDAGTFPIIAFDVADVSVRQIGGAMAKAGWFPGVQASPDSIHLTISLMHEGHEDEFVAALDAALTEARRGSGSTAPASYV